MINANKDEVLNTIKLLIYKKNPELFENLDFKDDDVFLEPLLFSYFNNKLDGFNLDLSIEEILQDN